MNIQYKKGVIELCVLSALSKSDMYGYEISTLISQEIDISDGTVYPILRKLKSEGLVTTYLSEISGGPPRKYYSITALGKQRFIADAKAWLEFSNVVNNIIGDISKYEQE